MVTHEAVAACRSARLLSWVPTTDLAVVAERVSGLDRELLSETFVELTDTMVADFDVIDFLHVLTDRSVKLLDVSAAGLLLAASCASWLPRVRLPGCWSYSSCRTTRVRAWTASGPASLSRRRTWTPRRSAGRGSRPLPGKPGSRPCRRCRCGCAIR